MKSLKITALLMPILFIISCATKQNPTTTLWINSYQISSSEDESRQTYLVQTGDTLSIGKWEKLESDILGFDYKPGSIYKIEVSAESEPSLGDTAQILKYKLIRIVNEFEDSKLIINDIWALKLLNGDSSVFQFDSLKYAPTLEIQLASNRMTGNDGCNNIMCMISEFDTEIISFGPIAGTKKFCADMALPDEYHKALEKTKKWSVLNGQLQLKDNDEKTLLTFEKID